MNEHVKDPRFWRDRAEETRAKAEGFLVAQRDRERLLKIASEYDQLADRAEQWRTSDDEKR